ncbi:MAG: acetyl-CoA carboxylase biotin carboxyl carrier protein [Victivallaceae bacterium]|nr:acetyl-CoA carboxylase biotin carboxyl carrier protein [Victivallaceae bacterium]
MKIQEIETIVKLMSDNDLTEFKIEAEEYNLCIRRGSETQIITAAPVIQQPAPVAAVPATAAPAAALQEAAPVTDQVTIDSPIVGTFYAAASPETDNFVNIGDKVTADTVVCIVEAMKVMNEIKAEKSGVIKEVLVDNANPVEFGQPLFVIE